MYNEETTGKSVSAIDEIRQTAKRRLEQCMVELDSLEKQHEAMEMHRRSLNDETGTLKRILEASQDKTVKDVDLPNEVGAAVGYASY